MKRILVIGSTGVGKTTLANQLARTLDLHHIELDSLYWGPDWSERPREVFAAELAELLDKDRWVIDGNYNWARDLIWPHADTAVWLDYPLPIILWRLLLRTLRRTLSQEELWNGNREHFTNQFLSSDSLFLYALKSKKKHHQRYPKLFQSPQFAHLTVIHHHLPKQTKIWLKTLYPP
jgi:adenylate kinase family enzyme